MKTWILKPEHDYLGAHYDPSNTHTMYYQDPKTEAEAYESACTLTDFSDTSIIWVHGADATDFIYTACSCQHLKVGESHFTYVFAGDGTRIATPLLARTGDEEYILIEFTQDKSETLLQWLQWLAQLSHNNQRVFKNVLIEDASTIFNPLVLAGPSSRIVLNDYLADTSLILNSGAVANITLDKIPVFALHVPSEHQQYILCIPPQYARILWRSFLSFNIVQPVGKATLIDVLYQHDLSCMQPNNTSCMQGINWKQATQTGLVRTQDRSFVGARALEKLNSSTKIEES